MIHGHPIAYQHMNCRAGFLQMRRRMGNPSRRRLIFSKFGFSCRRAFPDCILVGFAIHMSMLRRPVQGRGLSWAASVQTRHTSRDDPPSRSLKSGTSLGTLSTPVSFRLTWTVFPRLRHEALKLKTCASLANRHVGSQTLIQSPKSEVMAWNVENAVDN